MKKNSRVRVYIARTKVSANTSVIVLSHCLDEVAYDSIRLLNYDYLGVSERSKKKSSRPVKRVQGAT